MIKRVVRRNEFAAYTGPLLRGLWYTYSAQQLNRTSSSSDPTGHNRTPCLRWPNAPFYHSTQELHPWGCLVHGFVGKRNKNPNSASRGRPGLFVGHSDSCSGYLVYHEDSDSVMTYGYVDVFPNRFPMKDRLMAGENPATLAYGDWRRWSNFVPSKVKDGPLSEFLTGKQIEVVLLHEAYPSFDGC